MQTIIYTFTIFLKITQEFKKRKLKRPRIYLLKKSVILLHPIFVMMCLSRRLDNINALRKWNLFCHTLLMFEREWKIGELYKQQRK